MILQEQTAVDLATPTGPMRTYMFRPAAKGKYPAVVLFSEIFQATGPIRRFAAFIAGHGYIVAVPEVYHELEPAGTVLAYDQAGSDKGNADKYAKAVSSYDSDARALLDYLRGLRRLHRPAGHDWHLHGRASGLSRGHEPRCTGNRLLLCHGHSQPQPGSGQTG